MAAVSPMWARKEIIAELLRYPFEQLGVYKVFTAIPADNAMAIKVNNHVGLRREAVLAHHFGKKRHAVIMRMLRPDYDRLYGDRNG
jgi:RimJ/RimL family protein N-acetyltransferase